jgi:FKBP-type peptidyl-prolyl cis-trans isomerase (trigger factor)
MKAEVKKLDNIKTEINIEVSGDVVKNKFEDVFKRIAKEAKVAGFRPGNAPRDIIEKNYSAQAHEQVLRELVPDVYSEAIAKEGLDVIELPEITDVKLDRSKLSFKATVEVNPEITLKNYKGIKINYKKISVTADEIKHSLDSLKEARKVEAVDDKFANSLGYPNLQELEQAIQRQIFLHKDNQERQRIESEIIEVITGGLDFKLPASLVSRQLQDMLRQAKLDLALKGMPREKIDGQEGQITQTLEPQARKQVQIYLVLAAIAKKENIALDDNMPRRVMELLLKYANWQEAV